MARGLTLGGFRRELTPTWLHLACLLGGHRPPDLTGSFRIAYLGTGGPATAAVAAAVHPGASVFTWSPRSEELEAATRLTATAGLANVEVHERPGVPSDLGGTLADVVVLDGVLASTTDARRAELVAAAASNVRPGGLVCATYRTTVGWSEIEPVQRLMRHVAARHHGRPEELVPSILDLLRQLRDGGARHLVERPAVVAWLDELLVTPPDEVEARLLLDELHPMSHAEAASAFADHGCSYVGSALLPGSLAPGAVPEALTELVAEAGSPVLREAYLDLIARPPERLDLFRRGRGGLDEDELAEALAGIELVTLDEHDDEDGDSDPRWPSEQVRVATLVGLGRLHPAVVGGESPVAATASTALADAFAAEGISLEPAPDIGSALLVGAEGPT